MLKTKYEDQGIGFVLISRDKYKNEKDVRSYFSLSSCTMPVLLDQTLTATNGNKVVLCPTTIIINRDREYLYYDVGYLKGEEAKMDGVLAAIAVGSPPEALTKLPRAKNVKPVHSKYLTVDHAWRIVNSAHDKYDDFEEITWYYGSCDNHYINENSAYIYVGIKDGSTPWLRFRLNYTDDDWLFIRSFIVKVGDERFEFNVDQNIIKREVGRGWIAEQYDVAPDEQMLAMFKAIANGGSVKIRLQGQTYYNDRTVYSNELNEMKNAIEVFDALAVLYNEGEI